MPASLRTSELMVLVVAGAVDHLLSVHPKQPNLVMPSLLSAGGTRLLLHSIALLQDILGHTTILAKVCTMVPIQLLMLQAMVFPTVKVLLHFLNSITHSLWTTWVPLVTGPLFLMEARLVMVLMIMAMLLHPHTNLHHIHSNLEAAVAIKLEDFFSFFFV